MQQWFSHGVLSAETKTYIDNFLAVTQSRPQDDDDMHSDDQFSDEDLIVDAHNFQDVLKTRMSGKKRQDEGNENEDTDDEEKTMPMR